jgi:hypothetical protein
MQSHLLVYRKTALYSGSKERLDKFYALCHDVPQTPSYYIYNTAINDASVHSEYHADLSSVRAVRSLLHSYPQTVAFSP